MKPLLYALAGICLLSAFIKPRTVNTFVPPGTVAINDSLFIDKTEVCNFDWLEYEAWIVQKYGHMSAEHQAMLPDTLIWRKKLSYNEPYVEFYYRHPAYHKYPVVGISYEQAVAYCKWRSERVYEKLCLHKKQQNISLNYRLPSIAEWEFCSNNASNIPWATKGRNEKGVAQLNCINANTKVVHGKDTVFENADVTTPVQSYTKNAFGAYNMIGNVAEMVLEKGICKGGSWTHRLEDCRPGKNMPYTVPEPWLGFRCVCIVRQTHS
ncbi:MAG: SUMF1/EgtB/PvdO family nonheme iron enzyme [Bacteroidetes bacterium]|nr:SUMF1/EgtB/PvdO family nonheme iron enzyme [Bacteroidota bacterium]